VSRPVDPDCVGTGLAVRWWLEQQQKEARVACLFPIPETMQSFPDIHLMDLYKPDIFRLPDDHVIILVDGSSWMQFFGPAWPDIVRRLDRAKIINIDHHEPEDISASIPDCCLNRRTSSTAQLFFESLMEPSRIHPSSRVADYLYRALLYDTRNFRIEPYPGMYRFADALLRLGADHLSAVDTRFSPKEIDFLTWAIAHTEYLPILQTTLLAVSSSHARALAASLGAEWQDYDSLYKEVFLRQVAGYNYGLILIDNRDGTIKLSWRTRSCGSFCSIADVARRAGFRAGGHRNAGGGFFQGDFDEARTLLLASLRKSLQTANESQDDTGIA